MSLLVVVVLVALVIVTVLSTLGVWVSRTIRREARSGGYAPILEYLRAVPRSDREKAVGLALYLGGIPSSVRRAAIRPSRAP